MDFLWMFKTINYDLRKLVKHIIVIIFEENDGLKIITSSRSISVILCLLKPEFYFLIMDILTSAHFSKT